jgi:hypothetical protein
MEDIVILGQVAERYSAQNEPKEKSILDFLKEYYAPNFEVYRKKMEIEQKILTGKIEKDRRRGLSVIERINVELRDYDDMLDNRVDDLIIYQLPDTNTQIWSFAIGIISIVGKERIENEIQDAEVEDLPFSLKPEEIKASSKLLGLTEILNAGIENFGYELNLIFENLPPELKQIEQNFANKTNENIYKLQAHIFSVLTKSTITVEDLKHLENIIFKILDYVIKTWCEHEYRESLIELLEFEQASQENKTSIKEYKPPKRDGKGTTTSLSREQTFMVFQYLQKSKVILDSSFMYDTILAGYIHKMTGFSENTITRKSKNYKEDLQITQAKIKDILVLITKDLN